MMFKELEKLLKEHGKEYAGFYSIYDKNNPDERIDYMEDTMMMSYTNDDYRSVDECLNLASEERLKELYERFLNIV